MLSPSRPIRSRPIRALTFAAATALMLQASQALAYGGDLYGPPAQTPPSMSGPAPDGWRQGWADGPPGEMQAGPSAAEPDDRRAWRRHDARGGGECWAQVRYAAQYAPPPTGPEYVWTRQPGPPGSPGPIWCLTVQPMPNRPMMISPERYGWVRVLCNDQATAPRIAGLQRRLHARGLYRGRMDGRYDGETAYAVRRFQDQSHIRHRGYLSYETVEALEGPPPPQPRPAPVAYRQLTTFDTGYIDWPGKVRY